MELAVKTFKENAEKACRVLLAAIPMIAKEDWSDAIAEHKVLWIFLVKLIVAYSTLNYPGAYYFI